MLLPRRDKWKLKLRNWVKKNLPQSVEELKHIVIRSVADYTRTPSEVFELFLDDKAIKHLTAETVKYAFQFGNHNKEMQTFIGKLKLSGYNRVPRRRFYRSNEPNTRNKLVAQSMRRNCLDEIIKYFHAADNHQLLAEKM